MAKKTKLSGGAKSTQRVRPFGSGYYTPNVPTWSGAWDAANMNTPSVVTPYTTPYYTPQVSPQPIVPQYPEWDAAVNAYNASKVANAPPSGVPNYGMPSVSVQPTGYAQQLVGGAPGYGAPGYGGYTANERNYAGPDYNWRQEYYTPAYEWVLNDKGEMELMMNDQGPEGAVEPTAGWTSSYSADFYKNQWLQDKTYGLAGRNGNVTQLQYGRSQPDWVRKLKPNPLKPRDTNKTYDQSILEGTNPPAAKMSYPAWAGDLTTWRT